MRNYGRLENRFIIWRHHFLVNQILLISLLPLPKLTTSTLSLWPKQSKPISLVYIIWTSQIFCSKLFSPFGSGMCGTAGRNSSSSLLSRPSECGTYRNGTPQEADSCLKSFGFAALRTCCPPYPALGASLPCWTSWAAWGQNIGKAPYSRGQAKPSWGQPWRASGAREGGQARAVRGLCGRQARAAHAAAPPSGGGLARRWV